MADANNPALAALAALLTPELKLAQALVRRIANGFELRHISDREAEPESLRPVPLGELRALANHAATGEFRPIKSAPNLRAGWLCRVATDGELELALNQLYPGALADWFAAQQPAPPVTNYRAFTARQTGMYRITTMLTDTQAAQVIRACCDERFCLKRRLWSVDSLAADAPEAKSLIPCLEPCAVMMEFARKAVRIEQEEAKQTLTLAPSEVTTLLGALDTAVMCPPTSQREADVSAAGNPRRVQLLREKLQGFVPVAPKSAGE